MSELNVELLRKVQDAIRTHPNNFHMGDWFRSIEVDDLYRFNPEKPSCGTTACIAGWAIFLALPGGYEGYLNTIGGPADIGANLLGIDDGTDLFYNSNWPEPFRTEYLNAPTRKDRADVACRYIDHFIEQHAAPALSCAGGEDFEGPPVAISFSNTNQIPI